MNDADYHSSYVKSTVASCLKAIRDIYADERKQYLESRAHNIARRIM